MQSWTLSLRTAAETGLPSVDVAVQARGEATVADLARAIGQHVAPDQPHLLLVPVDGGHPWPADRLVSECGLRTGDLLDVVTAPVSWLTRVVEHRTTPRRPARHRRARPRSAPPRPRQLADPGPRPVAARCA